MSQAELLIEEAPIQPFQFKNHPIRTQLEGGNLWFAARDVCEALPIKWNGRALSAIPDEWQGLRSFLTPSGNQQLRAILEPAVYKLAFRSNKPEADAFTNWIASEVVPSIRKTGRYEITETSAATLPLSTTDDRKPLRALVGSWAQVSGLPFAACWNQLKAAFQLATIRELPQEWIPDAIDWVQKRIDALPAPALDTALPTAPSSPADDAEDHLAAIREHIRHIHRHEEALFLLARKALPSVRKPGDMYRQSRRMGLTAFQSMEDCSSALHHSLRALESATRTMLAMDRM